MYAWCSALAWPLRVFFGFALEPAPCKATRSCTHYLGCTCRPSTAQHGTARQMGSSLVPQVSATEYTGKRLRAKTNDAAYSTRSGLGTLAGSRICARVWSDAVELALTIYCVPTLKRTVHRTNLLSLLHRVGLNLQEIPGPPSLFLTAPSFIFLASLFFLFYFSPLPFLIKGIQVYSWFLDLIPFSLLSPCQTGLTTSWSLVPRPP